MTPAGPTESPQAGLHLGPWRLFWRRLKQRRIAMFGGLLLVLLYLAALFAGFIAPYHYERQDRERFFHPPLWPHWQGLRLVVSRDNPQPGNFKYLSATNDAKPLRWFVRGDKHVWLGLFPSTLHLFGTGDSAFWLGNSSFTPVVMH